MNADGNMKCEEIRELLTRYLLGDLDEATASEVGAHLEKCDGCRAAAREIEPTLDLLRDALAAPSKAPEHLTSLQYQRIINIRPVSIRRTVKERLSRISQIDWWITKHHRPLAVAAAALVVVGFFWVLIGSMVPMFKMGEVVSGLEPAAVQIMEPEAIEELDEIEEIKEIPPVPSEPIDEVFTPDVSMPHETPPATPPSDFSPQPAEFDAVAIIKSPVIMKGIYGSRSPGMRGSTLRQYGGGMAGEAEQEFFAEEDLPLEITFAEPQDRDEVMTKRKKGKAKSEEKSVKRIAVGDKKGNESERGDFIAMGPASVVEEQLLSEEQSAKLQALLSGIQLPKRESISEQARREREKVEEARKRTLKKLDKIVIPEINFKQANIRDVVDFLTEATVEFDSSADPDEKKGANIILNLPSAAAPIEPPDIFAEPEDEADLKSVGVETPLITFSARYISTLEALKIVTEVANLKYNINGENISVVPRDAPEGDIIVRAYDVLPSAKEDLPADGQEDLSLKQFFAGTGVRWPAGSSIKYIPSIGKLVVANTEDNLEAFENVLAELNVREEEPPEEAKVEEKDLTGPRFKAVGVNPFYSVSERPFSTFAIDVDTAAYTLTRNYMQRGFLPPAEAVRTEEFVNFFDYAYKPPLRKTFRIYTECAPSKFGRGLHLLKIGVKGKRLGREEKRSAALTFVIDTSGSMNTFDRIGLVKKSLHMLIERLAPSDRIAIIQFGSHARLILDHTFVSEKEKILASVDGLQTSGSTNLEEAMKLAYHIAARNFAGGFANRILVMSDGAANLGAGAAEEILNAVEQFSGQGIYCSVFGFGIGTYNDEMLEVLANKGDGTYTFIDSEEEAKRVFVDDLAATLNTIGSDVKIQVQFNPKVVKCYRQLGYENRQLKKEQFRDDTVDAGEVGSGQAVTALYEMQLQADDRRQSTEDSDILATVRVRYRRADNGVVEEMERAVRISDVMPSFDEAGQRFRLAACVAEFAEILRACPHAAGSTYEDVAKAFRPVALELNLDKRVGELLRMVENASGMSRGNF